MNITVHPAHTRGHAHYGWLDTWHSFSFAHYYNPDRMNFGELRVLNDDTVQGGKGFGQHPHDNMEIISIPLSGELAHHDNMGNRAIIRAGDVQIMSAGTGIVHAEFNNQAHEPVSFLQIWILPKLLNIAPRYEQRSYPETDRQNRWQLIAGPAQEGEELWINQDAWLYRASLSEAKDLDYTLRQTNNGVYLFIIAGTVSVNQQKLNKRDGAAITQTRKFCVQANTPADLLLIEVPLTY